MFNSHLFRIWFPVAWITYIVSILFATQIFPKPFTHEFVIREEIPVGSLVGSALESGIYQSQTFGSQSSSNRESVVDGEQVNFTILNTADPGVNCFKVKPDGKILTKKRIDFEMLCPSHLSHSNANSPSHQINPSITNTEEIYCPVTLELIRHSSASTEQINEDRIQIRILIVDINDNAPYWPGHMLKYQLTFRDGDPIGEKRTLPPAIDPDACSSTRLHYQLHSTENDVGSLIQTDPFRLVQDASDGLYVYTTRILDREEKESYIFILLVTDYQNDHQLRVTQTNKYTSSLTINVHVEDINDNTPIFTQEIFTTIKPIPETTPVGQIVLKLNASDKDTGINGAIHYGFSRAHTWFPQDTLARYYFDVRPDGSVVVRRPLDVDQKWQQKSGSGPTNSLLHSNTNQMHDSNSLYFRFRVIAEDEAVRPYSRSSEATVELIVGDENDEPPQINLRPVMPYDSENSMKISPNIISVMENRPIGTLIATIQSYDPDFQGSDTVECHIGSQNFNLIPTSNLNPLDLVNHPRGTVTYELRTGTELDRESHKFHMVPIYCSDLDHHQSVFNATVYVEDENDNAPSFGEAEIYMEVEENAPLGTPVRLVNGQIFTVVDKDAGNNANIYYQLSQKGDVTPHFRIHTNTGVLTTASIFDREQRENYVLEILAIDMGNPQNTGVAKVHVKIVDVNDDIPEFTQSDYTFRIKENEPTTTLVGQLMANDSDGPLYQKIQYFLSNDPDALQFRLDVTTGTLHTRHPLDREERSVYVFRVLARDANDLTPTHRVSTKQHTGTATVSVVIQDENDNWPVFISPNATANTLAVALDETLGHKLAYIKATDADEGRNGLINYQIYSGNDNNLFGLDDTSGLLYLAGTPKLVDMRNRQIDDNKQRSINKRFNREDTFVYSLVLKACDSGDESYRKCTTFDSLKVLLQPSGLSERLKHEAEMYTNMQTGPQSQMGSDGSSQWKDLSNQNRDMTSSNLAYYQGRLSINERATHYTMNEIIIICLSALFTTVLLATLILVCLLRRRSPTDSGNEIIKRKENNIWGLDEVENENGGKHVLGMPDMSIMSTEDDLHLVNNQTSYSQHGQIPVYSAGLSLSESRYLRQLEPRHETYMGIPQAFTDDEEKTEGITGDRYSSTAILEPSDKSSKRTASDIMKRRSLNGVKPDYQTLDYLGLVTHSPQSLPYPSIYSPSYRGSSQHQPELSTSDQVSKTLARPSKVNQLTHMNLFSPPAIQFRQVRKFLQTNRIAEYNSDNPVGHRSVDLNQCWPHTPVCDQTRANTHSTPANQHNRQRSYDIYEIRNEMFDSMTKSHHDMNTTYNEANIAKTPGKSHTHYEFNHLDKPHVGDQTFMTKSKSQQIQLIPKTQRSPSEFEVIPQNSCPVQSITNMIRLNTLSPSTGDQFPPIDASGPCRSISQAYNEASFV